VFGKNMNKTGNYAILIIQSNLVQSSQLIH